MVLALVQVIRGTIAVHPVLGVIMHLVQEAQDLLRVLTLRHPAVVLPVAVVLHIKAEAILPLVVRAAPLLIVRVPTVADVIPEEDLIVVAVVEAVAVVADKNGKDQPLHKKLDSIKSCFKTFRNSSFKNNTSISFINYGEDSFN